MHSDSMWVVHIKRTAPGTNRSTTVVKPSVAFAHFIISGGENKFRYEPDRSSVDRKRLDYKTMTAAAFVFIQAK